MSQTTCPLCNQLAEDLRPTLVSGKAVLCVKCGRFHATESFLRQIQTHPPGNAHLLAGAVRELNERGIDTVQINDLEELLHQVRIPRNPLEMMSRFLLSLRNQSTRADQHVVLTENDYALAYCHDDNEWTWICRQMAEMGLIEPWGGNYHFRIRPDGWQRLIELSKEAPNADQAFVAMSFDSSLEGVYNDGIESALTGTGYVPFRVDRNEHNGKIDDLIIAEIRNSGLLVADFTLQRNGVYFEAGFGLGLGIPVIWLCKDDEEEILKLHFDTRQYNHIMWTNAADLKEKLVNRINATAPAPKK